MPQIILSTRSLSSKFPPSPERERERRSVLVSYFSQVMRSMRHASGANQTFVATTILPVSALTMLASHSQASQRAIAKRKGHCRYSTATPIHWPCLLHSVVVCMRGAGVFSYQLPPHHIPPTYIISPCPASPFPPSSPLHPPPLII